MRDACRRLLCDAMAVQVDVGRDADKLDPRQLLLSPSGSRCMFVAFDRPNSRPIGVRVASRWSCRTPRSRGRAERQRETSPSKSRYAYLLFVTAALIQQDRLRHPTRFCTDMNYKHMIEMLKWPTDHASCSPPSYHHIPNRTNLVPNHHLTLHISPPGILSFFLLCMC